MQVSKKPKKSPSILSFWKTFPSVQWEIKSLASCAFWHNCFPDRFYKERERVGKILGCTFLTQSISSVSVARVFVGGLWSHVFPRWDIWHCILKVLAGDKTFVAINFITSTTLKFFAKLPKRRDIWSFLLGVHCSFQIRVLQWHQLSNG